jgi:predicted Zn-dependent protease
MVGGVSRNLDVFDRSVDEMQRYDGIGHNLRLVASHQIGHSLGLHHTTDTDSLMFSFYQLIQPTKMLPKRVSVIIIFSLSSLFQTL